MTHKRGSTGGSKPGRIAILSDHADPLAPAGGAECGGQNVYVREVSRALLRRGFEVDVFTFAPGAPDLSRGDGIDVHRLGTGGAGTSDKHALAASRHALLSVLMRRVGDRLPEYQMVYGHYYLSGWMAAELKRRQPDLVMVQTFHSLGRARSAALGDLEKPSSCRLSMERVACNRSDLVIAGSQRERKCLQEAYGVAAELVAVVPAGVDEIRFCPADQSSAKKALNLNAAAPVVLSVARLVREKGLDVLLRAAGELAAAPGEMEPTLVIVGGSPAPRDRREMDEIRRLSRQLGVEDRLKLTGPQQHDRLPLYYQAADLVVVPSLYDNQGLTGIEAMSCGRTVIVSNGAGLSELIEEGKTGFVVQAGNHLELAGTLKVLLENPRIRESVGARSRAAVVPRCSWSSLATRIGELLEEVPSVLRPDPPAPSHHPLDRARGIEHHQVGK